MGGLITKGHHVINPGHDTSRIVEVALGVSRSHSGHAPENVWIGAQELIRPYPRQRSYHYVVSSTMNELPWTFLLACLLACLDRPYRMFPQHPSDARGTIPQSPCEVATIPRGRPREDQVCVSTGTMNGTAMSQMPPARRDQPVRPPLVAGTMEKA